MKYKYMALDLDGTLVNSQKVITPKTKEMLMKAQAGGLRVILCSGRPIQGIRALAKELKLKEYGGFIVAFNGGKVMDCKTEEVIFERSIPPERLDKVFHCAKEFQVPLLFHDRTDVRSDVPDDPYVVLEANINHMQVKKFTYGVDAITEPIIKFIAVSDGEYLAQVEPKMKKALGEGFHVMRSEPFFLKIMAKNIEKSYALEQLLKHCGDTSKSLIACGDGYNDISMISYAGLGVAMENARDEVKKAADYITLSNDADGIAAVIEKFIG